MKNLKNHHGIPRKRKLIIEGGKAIKKKNYTRKILVKRKVIECYLATERDQGVTS